jgi:hypothetical protein
VGKYRNLGIDLDRQYRNDLNANFTDIDADVQAQKARVDNLITGTEQPSEVVDARGGATVLRDRLDGVDSSLAESAKKIPQVSVEEYEHLVLNKGLSNEDWAPAIQAAHDYVKNSQPDFPLNGGDVLFGSRVYKFTQVKISGKHIRLRGTGILNGNVLIKSVEVADPNSFNIQSLFTVVDGLRFIGNQGNTTTDAITIQNTRDVTIKNCHFENFRYGVYGEPLREDFKWQQTARVRIESCTFIDCVNDIKTKYLPWYEGISSDWVYHQHGDWTIRGCYFYDNSSLCVDMINMGGQDGLVCSANYFFHGTASGQSAVKSNNLYIKQSNFVIISDNNFFEAGLEAVKCEDVRTLSIQNNNIAWCGQRLLSSAIFVETTDVSTYSGAAVTIANNTINGTTQHGIFVGNNIINAMINGNNMVNEGSSPHYYGTDAIGSITHYSIYVRQPGTSYTQQEQVLIMNNLYSKPIQQSRGTNVNNGYMSYVKANRTFGNVVVATRVLSGTTSISGDINANSNPFNNTYPYIFKGWEGTVSTITGAKIGQIISILVNTATKTLIIQNSATGATDGIVLKGGANKTIGQFEPITLQKTDTCWIEI